MRNHLALLILLVISEIAWGQTVITGHLTSSGKSISSGVNILVHPRKDTGKIIAFALLDGKGHFRTTFTSPDDSISISTKSLDYKDTTICICNRTQELTIDLPVFVHEIKEVRVNSRAIIGKKDTISYLVSSFAQVKDQSIGDVIRKMPGFEVDNDGKISYQGNPIQKYYIEGMDLLENKYTIANKNLPHGAVGVVEVLENHQPIKALRSNTFSDGTSLNLKLKRNIAMTGTARTGFGLPGLLRDINVTPMLFNAKQQIIATIQANNIGDDLNAQNKPLQVSNGLLDGLENRKPELVGISTLNKPQINRQRYLNNDAYLLSYNHLVKVSTLTELKINAGFYQDHQKESGEKTSLYYLSNGNYTVHEIANSHYYNTNFNTSVTLTQNANTRYLKNQLSINRFWDHETGAIFNPGEQKQKAETPHSSVSNTFDLLLPIRKNFFRIYSLIDYNNSPQNIRFSPGIFRLTLNGGKDYSLTEQFYSLKEFNSRNYLRFTLSNKSWSFDTETGINLEVQRQRSYIEKDNEPLAVDSLNNKYRWNSYETYLTESFRYEKQSLRIGIETPIRLVMYQIDDEYHPSIDQTRRFLFSPAFKVSYDFNGFWSGNASVRRSVKLGDASQLTQGYIITGYRNMQRRSNKLDDNKGYSYSMGLKYKNPISGFFTSLYWIHSQTTKELLYRSSLTGSGLYYYEAIERDNKFHSDNVSMENSWFIASQKITLGLNANYHKSKREYLLGNQQGWLNNELILINPSIGFNRWKNFGFEYNCELSYYKQRNLQITGIVNRQTHKFSFYYYPSEKHWIGTDMEYYQINQKKQPGEGQFFANASYNYKPKNGRVQYRLKCSNLFNISKIQNFQYGDIALFENCYYIRKREIMLSVSFPLNQYKKQ